jgi:dolichol-phosphate mannosyltransferase
VGAAFKTAVEYARKNGYEVIISVAGNNKMEPSEIPGLLRPIFEEGYDFVQGLRYLKGGRCDNIPYQRYIIQRVGSGLIRLIFKWPGNDVSCGFRAVAMDLFNHPQVNIFQDWLERYGLESYIQFKAIQYGFKIKQVPASMIYPSDKKIKYSKIPSLRGWWDMAYPWIVLRLGLKK